MKNVIIFIVLVIVLYNKAEANDNNNYLFNNKNNKISYDSIIIYIINPYTDFLVPPSPSTVRNKEFRRSLDSSIVIYPNDEVKTLKYGKLINLIYIADKYKIYTDILSSITQHNEIGDSTTNRLMKARLLIDYYCEGEILHYIYFDLVNKMYIKDNIGLYKLEIINSEINMYELY